MRPLTPSVGYHIHFSRVVVYSNIIILDKLQISSLPMAKVWLREDILKTLTVHIKFTSLFHKVIPPNLEAMKPSGQLEIRSQIVLLMLP
jgi:hypothetical protein